MGKLNTVERAQRVDRSRRILWVADNKGVLTKIAEELGVTQPFVSDVFYGRRKSRNGDVEKRLAEFGAPGF